MKTLYEILGIQQSATTDEVKAAYRRAAMRWHPDRNAGNIAEAEARFKELAHAYAVLSDSSKRAAYDAAMLANTSAHEEPEEDADAVFLKAMFELASIMASNGYNRDVLMGALLVQGCPERVAAQIAQEVTERYAAAERAAKQSSRKQASSAEPTKSQKQPTHSFSTVIMASLVLVFVMKGFDLIEERDAPPTTITASPVAPAPKREHNLLTPQVESFNEQTGVGQIVYSFLPQAEMFDGHRQNIGQPYEIRLIHTIKFHDESRRILFFSSKPIEKYNGEAFECHACAPIISAMLLDEIPAKGLGVVLPLQPLMPAGTWGKTSIEKNYLPSILQVGPEKIGFILKHGDSGQGHTEEWGTIHGIEKDGFKNLGEFHVHSDSFAASQCEGKSQADCPQKDTRIRFIKSSVHFGYFDLAVTEKIVEVNDDVIQRKERQYTLRYNGTEYSELKAENQGILAKEAMAVSDAKSAQ